ncbi:hypothetical protein ALC57_03131 [Trachymyrmex cornetzi]|uniref:Nuclease HARBI1 n=1 Tax=Trachymyrmex cornetzi TaxID=471704 RepID=A0A151JMQ9_9HYME|nr:hypothetical protein ALC57_03131 [Trachymyrmex cornetzi]
MVTSLILDKNFESDSSQSSESEHENEDETLRDMQTLYCTLMGSKARGKMIATEKITDYVDRVIPNYSDIAFKEYFRMFPATFEMILSLIGPALNKTNTVTGTKPISVEKQLYITLWFMATPDSYRELDDILGKKHNIEPLVICGNRIGTKLKEVEERSILCENRIGTLLKEVEKTSNSKASSSRYSAGEDLDM